jgi:hypothetical protein
MIDFFQAFFPHRDMIEYRHFYPPFRETVKRFFL